MAYTTKTEIGHRNLVVQNSAGSSTTIWLEVESLNQDGHSGLTCLALMPEEAMELGRVLLMEGEVQAIRVEAQLIGLI